MPVGMVNSFMVVFGLTTLASKVSIKSGDILNSLKNKGKGNKYLSKKIQSIRPLKIYASSNFVEQQTPLVILNFAFVQTVSFLLLNE